jgi:hypothetical protein
MWDDTIDLSINPCGGCEDWDEVLGCISKGACADTKTSVGNDIGIIDDIEEIRRAGLQNGVEYKTLKISRKALDQLEAEVCKFVHFLDTNITFDRLFGMKIEPTEETDYYFMLVD